MAARLAPGASGCPALVHRCSRPKFGLCPPLELRGKASQLLGDKGIGGIVGGPPAMFGLVLEVLGRCHGWMDVLARLLVGFCYGALLNAEGRGRFLAPRRGPGAGTASQTTA